MVHRLLLCLTEIRSLRLVFFGKGLQEESLGNCLKFSTSISSSITDGQSEKDHQTLEDMLGGLCFRMTEFKLEGCVFLKVSPFRGVKRFGIKGKLSPRFIGPFEILERIGEVSYRLALPPQLSHVHDSDQSKSTAAPSSSKTAASAEYTAWTTVDTRLKPSVTSILEDLHMDDDLAPDEQFKWKRIATNTHDRSGRMQSTQVNVRQTIPWWSNQSKWYPIRYGLKKNASMTLLLCMVSLTGGSNKYQCCYIGQPTSEGRCKACTDSYANFSDCYDEVFSLYEYDYMKNIFLRRADLKEHIIAERDFKYLYPSDFEDLYLLNLQGHLDHLPPKDKKILTIAVNVWTRNLVIKQRVEDFQLGIESYQTQLNLTKPRWDATGFEYKHDFTVIESPRAVTFRDKYGVQMITRFNEIHKFSDGTLHQIDEALDYRVTKFKVNRMNPGLDKERCRKKQGVYVCHSETA
ncbi:hypothetical protein Tco_0993303 [Tanacetum coccineum]|uniref:Tf2-1-like SH3-like domain-containing protein n=1 Tax=Tanacetum coccineum TaxID=301880 RepID=A0ABQ5F5L7_9ASTR